MPLEEISRLFGDQRVDVDGFKAALRRQSQVQFRGAYPHYTKFTGLTRLLTAHPNAARFLLRIRLLSSVVGLSVFVFRFSFFGSNPAQPCPQLPYESQRP